MSRKVSLGVPCGKCGETIYLYDGERPAMTDTPDIDRFTVAVGPGKGTPLDETDDRGVCPVNGCRRNGEEEARTFNPKLWNEIRVD